MRCMKMRLGQPRRQDSNPRREPRIPGASPAPDRHVIGSTGVPARIALREEAAGDSRAPSERPQSLNLGVT
jgi:hypothetical protein